MIFPEKALSVWAQRLRQRLNLPVRLRWAPDGSQADHAPVLDLGTFEHPAVGLTVRHAAAVPLLLAPTLENLGEAYVEGWLDVDGSLDDVLDVAHRLAESGAGDEPGLLARAAQRIAHSHHHTKHSDREAIQYHYDVSNDFYAQWLDPAMVYSCAYFENGDETLERAQQKKIDHILTKIRLQPGQTLLDIGCGWGALVIRAAQQFGARCVGITLSQNQHDLARERVRAAGLQDQIDIRLQDYRDVPGHFDRITSVGMFEHVGLKHLEAYFRRIHDLLAPDGWALNHGITSSDAHDGEVGHGGGRFIDRYVFPDGELPHIATVLRTMQQGGLEALDVESLRRHYAHTLKHWTQAFEARADVLRAMVDEKRWRIWRIYLAGSQWAFEHDEISLYQVVCRRAGQHAGTLPWSRRYIYE